ncbi:conserved hypothetical protein [Chlamydia pneumoniae LPCoLN]|uniref:hypothetical protein n=1 Tax=Chlamydia pneumoniae TaxID=83558 RepID=UPI0001BD9BBD|nr:hypothetical protein [Chlamydia pneumoniae]ACZ33411.1 conserved hypothetical protein [Chlamydia pneumoniae LPCoLN]
MDPASPVAPNVLQDHVQLSSEELSALSSGVSRVKKLTIAIMILSLIAISLVACGLFLTGSAPLQLSIWIAASCITLSMLVCACWRYKISNALEKTKVAHES